MTVDLEYILVCSLQTTSAKLIISAYGWFAAHTGLNILLCLIIRTFELGSILVVCSLSVQPGQKLGHTSGAAFLITAMPLPEKSFKKFITSGIHEIIVSVLTDRRSVGCSENEISLPVLGKILFYVHGSVTGSISDVNEMYSQGSIRD